MNIDEIVSALDAEIARLQTIRGLVAGTGQPLKRRGRPVGSVNRKSSAGSAAPATTAKPGKRTMSAEGRARIAAAQRARWARQGASTGKKSVAKKAGATKRAGAPAKGTKAVAEAPAGAE